MTEGNSRYQRRFNRLLDFGENPLPGDMIQVLDRARNSEIRGKIGKVIGYTNIDVEIAGENHNLTVQSVEVLQEDLT